MLRALAWARRLDADRARLPDLRAFPLIVDIKCEAETEVPLVLLALMLLPSVAAADAGRCSLPSPPYALTRAAAAPPHGRVFEGPRLVCSPGRPGSPSAMAGSSLRSFGVKVATASESWAGAVEFIMRRPPNPGDAFNASGRAWVTPLPRVAGKAWFGLLRLECFDTVKPLPVRTPVATARVWGGKFGPPSMCTRALEARGS